MTAKGGLSSRWPLFVDAMKAFVPHLASVYDDEESFIELRIKVQQDGTTLAIAKCFGSDGGPMVCFASGYGYVACLMAIDAAIQGNRWRTDKPWNGQGK